MTPENPNPMESESRQMIPFAALVQSYYPHGGISRILSIWFLGAYPTFEGFAQRMVESLSITPPEDPKAYTTIEDFTRSINANRGIHREIIFWSDGLSLVDSGLNKKERYSLFGTTQVSWLIDRMDSYFSNWKDVIDKFEKGNPTQDYVIKSVRNNPGFFNLLDPELQKEVAEKLGWDEKKKALVLKMGEIKGMF